MKPADMHGLLQEVPQLTLVTHTASIPSLPSHAVTDDEHCRSIQSLPSVAAPRASSLPQLRHALLLQEQAHDGKLHGVLPVG